MTFSSCFFTVYIYIILPLMVISSLFTSYVQSGGFLEEHPIRIGIDR